MSDYVDYGFAYPVAREVTPLDEPEMAAVFVEGHKLATGKSPGSKKFLECALAIIACENGDGKSIICHNWGNLYAGTNWKGPFWWHPHIQPGQPVAFRAYNTHELGCAAWWELMYTKTHRRALYWAAKGNPVEMVNSLYGSAYVIGGSEGAYRQAASDWSIRYHEEGLFSGLGPYRSDVVAAVGAGVGLASLAAIGVARAVAR